MNLYVLNLNYNIGFFLAMIIPFFLLLIIARFRGFLASIFFFPTFIGLVSFALTFSQVNTMINKLGSIGTGLLEGAKIHTSYFSSFHNYIIELLLELFNKNELLSKVLNSSWFVFAPYLVLFAIFFILFKKRKQKREDDYF